MTHRISAAVVALALGMLPLAAASAPAIHGIRCESMEGSVFHIHSHIALYDHGVPIPIPANVGQLPEQGCLYWLHTHTSDGIVHIESPVFRTFTLGDFFAVWGQPLSATSVATARVRAGQVRVWVDGRRYVGEPAKIELAAHADVTIEAGPPYAVPKPFTDWQGQ